MSEQQWQCTSEAERCVSKYGVLEHGYQSRCELKQGHPTEIDHQYGPWSWPASTHEIIADLRQQLAAAEQERDRLRRRTHEIQERADKELAPLRHRYEALKEGLKSLRRYAWHPDDGSANARYAYDYLWEREKRRAEASEQRAVEAEGEHQNVQQRYDQGIAVAKQMNDDLVLLVGQLAVWLAKECPSCAAGEPYVVDVADPGAAWHARSDRICMLTKKQRALLAEVAKVKSPD